MNETNGAAILVDQVNRAAISDVNAKADVVLVRDQPVASFEAAIGVDYRINDGDVITVNLPGRNKFPVSHPKRLPRLPMYLVEILQHSSFVVRHLNSRDTTDKSMTAAGGLQCRKYFDRQNATLQANSLLPWYASSNRSLRNCH